MMSDDIISQALIDHAEAVDKKLGTARIRQLAESYSYFASLGITESQIKEMMALTSHEMSLIRKQLAVKS
jgi:hypothetical protein